MINSMTKWLSVAISISEEHGCVFQCSVFEFWHCRLAIVKIRNKIKIPTPFSQLCAGAAGLGSFALPKRLVDEQSAPSDRFPR